MVSSLLKLIAFYFFSNSNTWGIEILYWSPLRSRYWPNMASRWSIWNLLGNMYCIFNSSMQYSVSSRNASVVWYKAVKVSFVNLLFLPEMLFQDSNESQNTERNLKYFSFTLRGLQYLFQNRQLLYGVFTVIIVHQI